MISCAYPGCPSTGNYEKEGKFYCTRHLPQQALKDLPKLGWVCTQGREN